MGRPRKKAEDQTPEIEETVDEAEVTEEVAPDEAVLAEEAEDVGAVSEEPVLVEDEAAEPVAAEPVAVEDEATDRAGAVIEDETVIQEPEPPTEIVEPPAEAPEVAEADLEAPEPVADVTVDEPAAEEAPAEEAAVEAEAPVEEPPTTITEPARRSKKRLPRSARPQKSKPKRVPAAERERKPIVRLPKPEHSRGQRKERRGVVVSNAMDKTIVVRVDTVKPDRRYKKVVRRSTKFHAHDEQNAANVGDLVRIVETRPLSKTKNWRLAEVVEQAK